MQYAFMSFSCPDLSLDAMLDAAADLGYAGVEPRLDAGHAHGVETALSPAARRAVKRRVDAAPVRICCLAASSRFADPAATAAYLDAARRALDLAGDLDVPTVRVFGGHFPAAVTRDEAVDNVSEALAALAGHAQARGAILCLETHDAWCDPRDVAQVMRNVNHPHVAVNWDVLHPVRTAGWPLRAAREALASWIRHVHMHDAQLAPGRIAYAPMGEGAIDHREVLQGLRAIDYQGYLSGEWIGFTPWQQHLGPEIARLRAYETQLA